MTTTSFTDLTMRTRSRSQGLVRTAFNRLLETRDRHLRRRAVSTFGIPYCDRLDLSELERRSLFECVVPERR